jgi:hypothetical protein
MTKTKIKLKEIFTPEDITAFKALIRKEVSKIFFDLYRKRSTWSK